MIVYEYPFNERIRTYLRLEHIFVRLGELIARTGTIDHHYALTSIFEIMDVAARADLKSDVLKDIEKQRYILAGYHGNPSISESALTAITSQLNDCFDALNSQVGKAGQSLADNDWLMSIRSRVSIPGGTCGFDLPAYYAWQHHSSTRRQTELKRWTATLRPLAEATFLLLKMHRVSGSPQKVMTDRGQFQQNLPAGRTFQLARLKIDHSTDLIPEISGNRLMISIRLMQNTPDGKFTQASEDSMFELTLCS